MERKNHIRNGEDHMWDGVSLCTVTSRGQAIRLDSSKSLDTFVVFILILVCILSNCLYIKK